MRSCRALAVNFQLNGPGGPVVAVHEAQQGGGELFEAGEVVGVTTFFWMTEKKIPVNRPSARRHARMAEVPHLGAGGFTLRSGVPGEG
jgi:hypothetical protein